MAGATPPPGTPIIRHGTLPMQASNSHREATGAGGFRARATDAALPRGRHLDQTGGSHRRTCRHAESPIASGWSPRGRRMFDPYHKWLGIPREEQPPDHYRLLGISRFETDPEVIDAAANRHMAYLQGCATGTHALLSQRLLNEVAAARLCLLTPEKKATYDARLRAKRPESKRPVGHEASTPNPPSSEQVPAPGVRRRSSDKRFPVLKGIDEGAKPYDVIPVRETPPRPRRIARKRSRLPGIASILIILVGVLLVQMDFFGGQRGDIETTKVEPEGDERGNERGEDRVEGHTTTVDVAEVEAPKEEAPKEDDSRSESPHRPVIRPTMDAPTNVEDGPPGEFRRFTGHGAGVLCVSFTPDGQYAVTGSRDRTIRVWDFRAGEEVRKFEGHELGVWGIAITSDQRRLASCGPDQTIRLWDFETGKEVRTFRGHTNWVGRVLFSRDERTLISSSSHSDDPTTRLWDVSSGIEVHRVPHFGPIALSPLGDRLLIGEFKTPVLWDGALKRERGRFKGHRSLIQSVAFSPDGESVVTASGTDLDDRGFVAGDDNSIRLWSVSTGRERRRLIGHENWVNSVAFSPDGKWILSGGGGTIAGHSDWKPGTDMSIRLWAVESGKEVHRFTGHREAVKSVAFSPDGMFALSGSEDGTARVWRLPGPPMSSERKPKFAPEVVAADAVTDRWEPPAITVYPASSFTSLFGGRTIDRPMKDMSNCTPASYTDFVLRFEYRLLSHKKQPWTGVRLRHGGTSRRLSVVLSEGMSGGLLLDQSLGGLRKPLIEERLDDVHRIIRPALDAERPFGEWNRCEVVCDGPKTTVAINDRVVNHISNGPSGTGMVCLGGSQGDMVIGNLRIAVLPHDK